MTTYFRYCIFFIFALFATANACAQSPAEIKKAAKDFSGQWVDKKTSRHLYISFSEDKYATISDWNSKFQKQESGDVYKAFVQNGKLVMPEDTEHHAPYSEIILKDNVLIYLTQALGPGSASGWEKQVFVREKYCICNGFYK